MQRDVDGQDGVPEVDIDHRILAVQGRGIESRKTRELVERVARIRIVTPTEPRFEHSRDRVPALGSRMNREEGVRVAAPLSGRFSSSQSRSSPLAPIDTLPVPMPPSGNAVA